MPTQAQVDAAVAQLSNVGKLVHLAWRYDAVMETQIAALLFKQARQNYEAELTRQASTIGCTRQGLLNEGAELSTLKQYANESAASIVRTYNFDLAHAIQVIRANNPRANRNTYAKALQTWDARRASWKDKQIALMTVSTSTQAAKSAFIANNIVEGQAYLRPKTAAEPVCAGIVAGNPYPLETINNVSMPVHVNCIHTWEIEYKKIHKSECADLWLGA